MRNQQIYTKELFFVRVLFPYIVGIVYAWQFGNGSWRIASVLLTAILAAALLFMQSFYQLFELYKNKGITGLAAAFFLFSGGVFNAVQHQDHYRRLYFANGRYDFLKVRIVDDPQVRDGLVKCKVIALTGYTKEGQKGTTCGNIMLYCATKDKRLTYGTEMIIPAKYHPIKPSSNPGEFDYQFWLSVQQIRYQSFIGNSQIVVLPTNNGNRLVRFAFALRNKQIKYYQKHLKNKDNFALASVLILGSRANLSSETLDIYSKTGTIHALSVSGMHVGLIYLVVNWAVGFLTKNRAMAVFKMVAIICMVWLYALVTGFSPSVLRSAIMLSVFLVGKTFRKQSNNYNILAFAGFCLLVYDPFYLFDMGFQLSFLAVFGLICLQSRMQYALNLPSTILQKLWGLTTISLAAQLATFPLSIYYFHQFPVYFIFCNLFITLPIALLLYLGLLILILKLDFLFAVFENLIELTNAGLHWFSELPYSAITGIWISKLELIFLSMTIVLLCTAFSSRKKKNLLSGLFCLLVYQCMCTWDQLEASHQQGVINFKLRNHQAKVYLKGRAALLVTDIKPADKIYKYSIQPALDLYRVQKLRIIHPDTTQEKK